MWENHIFYEKKCMVIEEEYGFSPFLRCYFEDKFFAYTKICNIF